MARSNRGGKRPGSGRPPGPLTVARRIVGDDPGATSAHVPPDVRAAIAFSCRGLSAAEIGRRLGHKGSTVISWCRKHPEIVDAELRALVDPAESLRQYLPRATQAYGEVLDSERDSVKLQAAEGIYDRVYGKPVVRTEQRTQTDIRILFIDATDDAT